VFVKKILVSVMKHVLKSLKEVRLQMWCDGENKSFNAEFTWKLATHKLTHSEYTAIYASQHHQSFHLTFQILKSNHWTVYNCSNTESLCTYHLNNEHGACNITYVISITIQ